MRGERSDFLFSYVSPEQRVPADHPMRPIRRIVDACLARLSPRFDGIYTGSGAHRFHPSSCCARCCCKCSITTSGYSERARCCCWRRASAASGVVRSALAGGALTSNTWPVS